MAQIDSTVPIKKSKGTLVFTDGAAHTLTATFEQASFTWTENGRVYTEAMARGRHYSTPTLIETDDGNVTGSFTCLITSFWGNAAVTPYEFLRFTGGASGYTTVGAGSKKAFSMALTVDKTEEGEATQVITFNYTVATELAIDTGGADGLGQYACSFVDHENKPTIT